MGKPSGRKGKKLSEATKKLISEKVKRNGLKPWLGKKLSEEHKRKMSIAKMGHIPWNKGLKGIMPEPWNKGKTQKDNAVILKIAIGRRGKLGSNWRGGVTSINKIIRRSFKYKEWRTAVFSRDNYTCVWCNYKGNRLQADHIKPFAYYPELRFELSNGRTLCIDCHRKTPTWGINQFSKKLVWQAE